jgi:hypothetical protein
MGVHPPPSPARADFSIMMECTPEICNCHYVCTLWLIPAVLHILNWNPPHPNHQIDSVLCVIPACSAEGKNYIVITKEYTPLYKVYITIYQTSTLNTHEVASKNSDGKKVRSELKLKKIYSWKFNFYFFD